VGAASVPRLRRGFLRGATALAGSIAVAGCSGLGSEQAVAIDLEPVSNREIGRRAALPIEDFERPQQRAIRSMLDGRDVRRFRTNALIENGTVVRSNGDAYEFAYRAVGWIRSASTFRITLERGAIGDAFIRTDTLGSTRSHGWIACDSGRAGTAPTRRATASSIPRCTRPWGEESMLVPTPEFDRLRWPDGTTATVSVTSESGMTLTLFDYERRVAWESLAAYGASFVDRFAVDLTNQSEAERAILRRAIAGSYQQRTLSGDETGLATLLDRFGRATPIVIEESGVNGGYVVRFESETNWATVSVERV
jgi:hypothetical protein